MEWTDKTTAANVAAWFIAPHPSVGSVMSGIANAQAGLDTATKAGSKTQSYTSWACLSYSYVCGFTHTGQVDTDHNVLTRQIKTLVNPRLTRRMMNNIQGDQPENQMMGDQPEITTATVPRAIWKMYNSTQKTAISTGTMIYHRGVLLTPEETIVMMNISPSEYILIMLDKIQEAVTARGLQTLGPDEYDLSSIYELAVADIRIKLTRDTRTHNRHRRSAGAVKKPTTPTPKKTTPATPVLPSTSSTTPKSIVDSVADATLTDDEISEIEAILNAIERNDDTVLNDKLIKLRMHDFDAQIYKKEIQTIMETTTTPKPSTTTPSPSTPIKYEEDGRINVKGLDKHTAAWVYEMYKIRAKLIFDYIKPVFTSYMTPPLPPITKPVGTVNYRWAAKIFLAVRDMLCTQNNVVDSPWRIPANQQIVKDISRELFQTNWNQEQPGSWQATQRHTNPVKPEVMHYKTIIVSAQQIKDMSQGKYPSFNYSKYLGDAPIRTVANHGVVGALPIKVAAVSTIPGHYEMAQTVPYSVIYRSFEARLSDPTNVGTLGAVVRSAMVRDSPAMLALTKSIRLNPGSIMDVAPIVRLLSMMIPLDVYLADRDPTPSEYLINVSATQTVVQITPKPRAQFPLGQMTIMPLDIFTAFMSNVLYDPAFINAEFHPNRCDIIWTAIPITTRILNSDCMLPYIMSFLDSDYYHGTVNWYRRLVATQIGAHDMTMNPLNTMITMPSLNTLWVPGCRSAILVVVDDSSLQSNAQGIQIGNANVPIWRATAAMQPVDLTNIWMDYWQTANIQRIRKEATNAYREIATKLATLNTCSLALSIVADAHLCMRPGYMVQTNPAPAINYNLWGIQMAGAWVYMQERPQNIERLPIDDSCALQAQVVDQPSLAFTGANEEQYEDATDGFNEAGLTAHHMTASGYGPIIPTYAQNQRDAQHLQNVYLDNVQRNYINLYNLPTSSSLMRVSIRAGLIDTYTDSILFQTPCAVSQWIHMLSVAQAANTSSFLCSNNITTANWAGFHTYFDDMFLTQLMKDAKDSLFNGFINHIQIYEKAQLSGWQQHYWNPEDVIQRYGIDLRTSIDWMSSSPVPVHLTMQWLAKLKMDMYPSIPEPMFERINPVNVSLLPIHRDTGITKLVLYSTIDFMRYQPIMIYMSENTVVMGMWVSNFNATSNRYAGAQTITSMSYLESTTTTMTPARIDLPYVKEDKLYVYNSSAMHKDSNYTNIRVSDIILPDPPSFESILTAAKNYVLGPATAGLMGMLAAGPPGAVIGAGSDLARQAITDVLKHRKQNEEVKQAEEKQQELIKAIQQSVNQPKTVEPMPTTVPEPPTGERSQQVTDSTDTQHNQS